MNLLMNRHGRWWTEARDDGSAGPTRPRVDLPKRLLVPAPRRATSGHVAIATAAPDVPGRLDTAWPAAPAAALAEDALFVRMSEMRGSVDLTGLPWNEVAPPPPEGADGPGDAGNDGDSLGPGEIPLWKRLAYLLRPPAALLLRPDGPVEWPGTLFPYQLDGVQALLARETLLLADDMGLGKTIMAAAALRILALRGQVEACLLIVPATLVSQWREALASWAPELCVSIVRGPATDRAWQWRAPAHVYLTGYETFREDCTDSPHSPPRRRLWDLVILDEAQRIKNRESEVSRKTKLVARRRAWALTGTPIENSLDDLASILEFVTPHKDGGPRTTTSSRGALLEKLRTLQLRRRKADVLPQLPPKITSHLLLPLGRAQRASYERAEREGIIELRERGTSVRIENVLDLLVKLKQICNFDPSSGESAKGDDLQQRVATLRLEGHRALVFTQFVEGRFGVRALAERLTTYRPLLYTGDMSIPQREATIREFKADAGRTVLILSLRAGGTGLNLQEASYVFHFDRWWNPAVERQAEDRSHRLGQTMPVNVYTYTCENTIEERIHDVLRQKQRLFDQIVDETTLDVRTALTEDELFGLFGLAQPR